MTVATAEPTKTIVYLPIAEAAKQIRRMKGKAFFLSVYAHLNTSEAPETRYFEIPTNVRMSRPELLAKLADLYRGRFEKDAVVKVSDHGRCVFVG